MKLIRAQAQNYRSIVDSGVVEIGERVTVIVGKNEQGKTTFLKALASFNPKLSYSPSDFPTHLRPSLEDTSPAGIPIITLWFLPDESEKKNLKEVVLNLDDTTEFKITRYYNARYEYKAIGLGGNETDINFSSSDTLPIVEDIKKFVTNFRAKTDAHTQRLSTFAASKPQADSHVDAFLTADFTDFAHLDNLIKTFITALNGLPGQDQAVQDDIVSLTKYLQAKQKEIQLKLETDPSQVFHRALPSLLFHSTILDKIPNEVSIQDFIKDPEGTSKGMSNLCGVAGLSIQKIQELASTTDTSKRESYEDTYRSSISGGINEFWTQAMYTVHFRIEEDKLSVSVSDGVYARRIVPADRSDGFQWYLSFYSALLNEASGTDATIIMLDNPGLELHFDGQRDIKRFLEEKLHSAIQIIYVTHSPAMIDPYNLEQIREVELLGSSQGTKVHKLKVKNGTQFDLLEPVRSAIGASLVSSLMFNEFNVLVEGAADKPILEGAFNILHAEESKKVQVNGSVSEGGSGNVLALFYFRAKLPFVIYLDADTRGRQLVDSLTDSGIPRDNIVSLDSILEESQKGRDLELEDLLSKDFYHKAVLQTYPDKSVNPQGEIAGKRTKYYENQYKSVHGIGFNKRRVSEAVKQLLIAGKADSESLENLKKLTQKLMSTLQVQGTSNRSA